MQSLTLAFITDPWCSDTGRMEVAATVHITLNTTQNQRCRVRRPTEGAFTLKAWASAALAFSTFVVAPAGEGSALYIWIKMIRENISRNKWENSYVWLQCKVPSPVYPLSQ